MSATNKPVFKTQINGYNKQNVNQYILDMNLRYGESEEKYLADIASLKAQNAAGETKIAENTAALEALSREKAEAEAKIASLDESIASLNAQLAEIKAKLASREEELENVKKQAEQTLAELENAKKSPESNPDEESALREQIKSLLAQNDTLRRENASYITENDALGRRVFDLESAQRSNEAQEKAELYDKMTSKLGTIMLNANTSAEAVINEANRKSDAIIAEAERRAGEISVSVGMKALNAGECLNDEIRASVHNCLDELLTEFDAIQYQLAAVLGNLGNRQIELDSRMEYYKHSLTDAIEKKIAELNER